MCRIFRPMNLLSGIVLVVSLLLVGCGSRTGTLTGTVRYQGKALTGGSVIVYCPGEQIVRGILSSDGTYSISDVPCGKVVVTIQTHPRVPEGMQLKQNLPPMTANAPRSPAEGAYAQNRPILVPRRYSAPEESGLALVVVRGTQTFDIDLKP